MFLSRSFSPDFDKCRVATARFFGKQPYAELLGSSLTADVCLRVGRVAADIWTTLDHMYVTAKNWRLHQSGGERIRTVISGSYCHRIPAQASARIPYSTLEYHKALLRLLKED